MSIQYINSLREVTVEMLEGFFVGWRYPLSQEKHLAILKSSTKVELAIDKETGKVVGFINCLSDGIQSAFIPLLEVLPEYQGRGIGSELVQRMLARLEAIPCVDLTCDPDVQPFYARFELMKSHGMVIRRYLASEWMQKHNHEA